MTNNEHCVSDVLCGAGIGIMIANLVYLYEPLNNWHPSYLKKDIVIIPYLNYFDTSFGFSLIF